MIRFAQTNDGEQIKRLWHEAFGDSARDIENYLRVYSDKVLLYIEDRFIKGMLSLLPVRLGSISGNYIYAAATDARARGRGIASKLIRYANKYTLDSGGAFTVLVPAEKSLYEFYKKRGFTEISAVKRAEFAGTGFGDTALEVKKISPERLYVLRKKYFVSERFIEWDIPELEYMWKIYNGNFFEIKGAEVNAFAVCSFDGGMLDFKELCTGGAEVEECIAAVNSLFNAPHCRVALPDKNGGASAMIYPPEYKDCYFNLAID